MKPLIRSVSFVVLMLASAAIQARGVSPYLPLNMAPEIERQIERVLILGGKPVMRRPIPAAVVVDALPAACEIDRALCSEVRGYIDLFIRDRGVTLLRPEIALASGDSNSVLPNARGRLVDSAWQFSASAFYQPSDYLLFNLGGIANDDEAVAAGSMLSLGYEYAQLDVGFRDHWLSPLSDSSSLISTEAPTMPSVTLSNYTPITQLGIGYEVFLAQMSRQEEIAYLDATTAGRPRLGGLHLSIEPVSGYALAVNRVVQYGGGARTRGLFSQFVEEMFEASNQADSSLDAEESNRVASLTSSLVFPGPTPFVARIEYAGEDNAFKGTYRLGATNLSLGLDFPTLWRRYDATLEVSDWQNSWYVHHLYPGGLAHRGRVLGHWFGDNRRFGEAIGGRSYMLRAGRSLRSGDYLQVVYRGLAYDPDWVRFDQQPVRYDDLRTLGLGYSTSWQGHAIDAELTVGRDVFGESFALLGAAFDFVPTATRRGAYAEPGRGAARSTEVFFDVGAQRSRVRDVMLDLGPDVITGPEENFHLAVGARKRAAGRHDIGVRLEFDRVADQALLSVRAVDYRFHFHRRFAVGGFFGVGRYDVQLPAYGYYMGAGLQYRDLLPGWDLGADFRYYDKMTRDKVLTSDPPLTVQLPRRSIDIKGMSLYLSRRW